MNSRLPFLVGFLMVVFANQAMWITFAPVASQLAAKLQVDVRWIGFLPVLYPVVFLFFSIPAGIKVDQNACKWVIVAGVLTAIGAVVRFAGVDLLVLYSSQLLAAVAQPLILNGFVPLTNRFYLESRPLVLSAMSISMYGGIAFGLLAGVPLYESYGVRGLVIPASLLSAAGLLLLLWGYRLQHTDKHTEMTSSNVRARGIFINPFVVVFGCILGLGVGTFDNLSTWLQPALSSTNFSHYAGCIMGSAILAGVLGVGVIAPVVARCKMHIGYLRFVLLYVLGAMFTISFYPQISVVSFLIITSSVLMFPAYPLIMEMVASRFKQGGLATGAVGLVSRIVTVILTLLASAYIGDVSVFFRFLSVPLLLGVVLIFLWKDKIF